MVRKTSHPSDPSGAGVKADIAYEPGTKLYHLVPIVRIRVGYIACDPGDPLCGTAPSRLARDGSLFHLALEVTCWMCAAIAKRDGIIAGGAA